jgi:hypothetical protein
MPTPAIVLSLKLECHGKWQGSSTDGALILDGDDVVLLTKEEARAARHRELHPCNG